VNFCNYILQSVLNGETNHHLIFFSDKAWFHLHR
jgi:hypothetical protein